MADETNLSAQYNPFVPPQLDDPYPVYALARRTAPVFFSQVLNMWVVTRHADITAVLLDTATFSSSKMITRIYPPNPEAVRVLKEGGYERPPLTVDNDPPDHTRVRSAINKAFTPQRAAKLEPVMVSICNNLVDAFERDGRADLLGQYAFPLPALVMLDLLGLPREDASRILAWVENWAAYMWSPLQPEQEVACAHGMVEYLRYCREFVRMRKQAPQDDLVSDLLRGQKDGSGALSDLEIALMVNDVVFAGQKSTAYQLCNAVRLLLSHPEQWNAIKESPGLLPQAIEEIFRVDSSAQAMTRTTTREARIAGVTIPAGAAICLMTASASHDEALFPEPERFDIHRTPGRHLAFGHGVHYCVGAGLARTEVRVGLDVLRQRLPNLRLAPDSRIEFAPNLILRGPKRLDVVWDPPRS